MSPSLATGIKNLSGAKNIAFKLLPKNRLALYVDLRESVGRSTSGKTSLLASTAGNRVLGKSGIILGFNCFSENSRIPMNELQKAICTQKYRTDDGFDLEIEEKRLICIVDCANMLGDSRSGTSILIASSRGAMQLGNSGVSIGLNAYYKKSSPANLKHLDTIPSQ
eukprot:CAMPEP_0201483160 /NCGR_PEP_ID=MMETSP0151_2-20130828/7382_1 /ASSEMBLY_ACC=CAM_ASM_000257 /TAXON_ID=200890 /ORGANISM="Paramoeba atlantica, Strain 621/1 / CCAP 1560/9" /LENGTH=165 /DNA_ID=CAMNT_0047866169 /DNA_START=61 /DNA_END=558 /DNA_ORIENTATION=-